MVSGRLLNYIIFNNTLWLGAFARAQAYTHTPHRHTPTVWSFFMLADRQFLRQYKFVANELYGSHLSRSNLWQRGNKTLPPPPTTNIYDQANQSSTTYTTTKRTVAVHVRIGGLLIPIPRILFGLCDKIKDFATSCWVWTIVYSR